jgi:hypothetical protein
MIIFIELMTNHMTKQTAQPLIEFISHFTQFISINKK